MSTSPGDGDQNPLYLLSAALVLAGCTVLSNSLPDGIVGPVGAALLAELYALCLIGGVALLTRLALRRPAVILALLALLYQWDLTFHTETAVFLGGVGYLTSGVWAALFAGKLLLLERALRLRLARHARLAASIAAAGLVVGPRMLPQLEARAAGALVTAWLFVLIGLAQQRGETLLLREPAVDLQLLRRLTRTVWALPGVLLAGHLVFLAKDHALGLAAVLPMIPLVFVRRVRAELHVWALVVGTLVVTGLVMPGAFSMTALIAAASLALRAVSPLLAPGAQPAAPITNEVSVAPYRYDGSEPPVIAVAPSLSPAELSVAERVRLFVGVAFALHFWFWTIGWHEGAFPAHVLPLPRGGTQWGVTVVSLGFLLLGGSLATTYRRATGSGRRSTIHHPAS